jgi:hypothetical protein
LLVGRPLRLTELLSLGAAGVSPLGRLVLAVAGLAVLVLVPVGQVLTTPEVVAAVLIVGLPVTVVLAS